MSVYIKLILVGSFYILVFFLFLSVILEEAPTYVGATEGSLRRESPKGFYPPVIPNLFRDP